MKATRFARMPGVWLSLGAALLALAVTQRPPEQQARPESPRGTVYVGGGLYAPLYADATDEPDDAVAPFFLDRHPVTNAEFLAFVRENPSWRRSEAPVIYAEQGYLQHWRDDLDFGPDSMANRPVVNVSWFAARAYAEWRGMRLPTTAEWELAAAAGAVQAEPESNPAYRQRVLEWYGRPASEALPAVGSTACNYWGVCDLQGLVWEWVDDFNSALVTGESRNNTDLDLTLFCGSAAAGASNFEDYGAFLRFGFRSGLEANYTVRSLGFRCAADAPRAIAKAGRES